LCPVLRDAGADPNTLPTVLRRRRPRPSLGSRRVRMTAAEERPGINALAKGMHGGGHSRSRFWSGPEAGGGDAPEKKTWDT